MTDPRVSHAVRPSITHAQRVRNRSDTYGSRRVACDWHLGPVVQETEPDISHDVKNILNPLSLQLEILRRRIDRGDREAALISIAEMRQIIRSGVELAERLRIAGR